MQKREQHAHQEKNGEDLDSSTHLPGVPGTLMDALAPPSVPLLRGNEVVLLAPADLPAWVSVLRR